MIHPRRILAVTASVATVLGAGAVVSAAQSPTTPAPTTAESVLAQQCERSLPTPTGEPRTFLKLQGIAGESTSPVHAGESDVDAFRFGASSFPTPGAGGGGKAVIRTMVIGKPYDSASPALLSRAATGLRVKSVVLTQDTPAGTFLRYTLNDVAVVDHEHTGKVRVNAERLCLKFATAQVEYRPQLPDGTLGAPVKTTLP
jgi:type VI secretion system secreted protein Hcp